MKIIFSHGGGIKLFAIQKGNADNYQKMRTFVKENLSKIPPNFVVKYKDEDGDLVVISNNKDIQDLFDSRTTDYVRATIQDGDKPDQQSDVSDQESGSDDSKNSEDLQNQESMLHSIDEPDQEEQYFANKPGAILNQQLSLSKENKEQQKIFPKTIGTEKQRYLEKQAQRFQDPMPVVKESQRYNIENLESFSFKKLVNDEPKNIQQAYKPYEKEYASIQSKENKQRKTQVQEQRVFAKSVSKSQPITELQPAQPSNPEQKPQKPPQGVTSSLIRSRISNGPSDKNISRIVRSLLNQELEERLQALIPKLMQRLKKQVRVSYPSILSGSDLQKDEAQQTRKEEPQQQSSPVQKTIHNSPCSGCMKEVIQGIRYKCLECEQNYCQECEKVINHEHNLLKMRFVQVKQQRAQKVIDHRIQLVNKCFFLSSIFGGEGRQYKQFVQKHQEKSQQELFSQYYSRNGKKLKKRMGERLIEMSKKLGMYFEQDYLQYVDLVMKNVLESFEGLVGYVKECGLGSEGQGGEESFSELSSSVRSGGVGNGMLTQSTRSLQQQQSPQQSQQQSPQQSL